ncbi:uncharacterized protein MONBRDRAFT_16448 [Monosiga brevicollis MX1]|uniref:Poly [ADP-ribose] polymerase n=1 Tax=Monosiga brevicollis TaxID=81824 RepID=A9UWX6_MONBE|nr:uncharacterized protein MONBRDRAFT_16448 [Monosiga brevicollis MX1]EDQ90293.1 predicted protein [Monosiga brevicollis MX1]|eukprot:XP_001745060.1 hypothetical protein [Monosiga brevicollis MX1]
MPPRRSKRNAAKAAAAAAAEEEEPVPEPVAPKRAKKAPAKKAAAVKEEEEEEPVAPKKAAPKRTAAKKAVPAAKKPAVKKEESVDAACHLSGAKVYSDATETFDCMLNQTNVGHNNNKFYIIQVVQSGGKYYCWTHWGRVGENGQNAALGPFASPDGAISEFKKKFKAKAANNWEDRQNFKPKAGKYTLIDMAEDDDEEVPDTVRRGQTTVKYRPSKLDTKTQSFVNLIFDNDMFKEQMKSFDLDTEKMPLGKISKAQIARGYGVLEELEAAINAKKSRAVLSEITSRFYTTIPHSFGRSVPPVIQTIEVVQAKKDMLTVLADIELAQQLKDRAKDRAKDQSTTVEKDHPDDLHYDSMHCDLKPVKKGDTTYDMIQQYISATGSSGWRKASLIDAFEVCRHDEDKRFAQHDDIENRRLLWHGTNVAVVAAILGSGLRIMPHSGGRVGRGIYLASEMSKSAGYVGTTRQGSKNIGIMFLVEAALGKEHHITRDDSSLRAPPKGFDCVIAKGQTEPDPKKDITVEFDGKPVKVPQGAPLDQPKYAQSSFSQSEYLLYKESQHRIRYVLKLQF